MPETVFDDGDWVFARQTRSSRESDTRREHEPEESTEAEPCNRSAGR
jgi:hypothetical protein